MGTARAPVPGSVPAPPQPGSLCPRGDVRARGAAGGGAPSLVANVVWLVIAGIPMALYYAVAGALFCVTVIGLPPGIQLFKMAKLSLLPFGAVVR